MKNASWPAMMPPDLRRTIDVVLSMRSPCAADVWTELREWLIKHDVEAPRDLPKDKGWTGPPKFY